MRLNPHNQDYCRSYQSRRLTAFFTIIIAGILILHIYPACKKPVKQVPVKTEIKCFSPKSGEIFASVLKRAEISSELSNKIIRLLQTVNFNFKSIRPEDTLKLLFQNDSLVRIDYKKDYKTIYCFNNLTLDFINISMLYKPIVQEVVLVKGEINSSLYESMLKIGEKPLLIANYTDALAWEVDFFTETQNGDSFFVLVDKRYDEDNFIDYGQMYAVRYKGNIGDFTGYYYVDPTGYKDFYDKDGKSMRKAFLKSPLRYGQISSYFSRGRYHPILKIVRPHHGIDYRAPSGTPVSAIGAGTVTYAGWKGGYGRFVEITHAQRFKSRYGHLRGYGKGIRSGQRVAQGQIVGYVGTTGLSTGPHLHFEMLQNGSWVNPLKVIPPRSDPVKSQYMPDFTQVKDSLYNLLYQ